MYRNFVFFVALVCFFVPTSSFANGNGNSGGGYENQHRHRTMESQGKMTQTQTSMANAEGGRAFSDATALSGSVALANPVSSAGVEGSGNSKTNIICEYPIEFITAPMLQPVILEDDIFQSLIGARLIINGIPVIVVSDRDLPAVRFAMSVGNVEVLDTDQNHGKQFLATLLHPRDQEYVGPVGQIKEMMARMPAGTRCVLVEIKTLSHTRGSAGAAGTGEQNGKGLTSQISANLNGSFVVPVTMTTATFLDREIEIVNCNDPAEHSNTLCK